MDDGIRRLHDAWGRITGVEAVKTKIGYGSR